MYTTFYIGEIQNFVIILKHDFSAGTTLIMYGQNRKICNSSNTKGPIKGLNRLSIQQSKMILLRCLCQTRTVSCHECLRYIEFVFFYLYSIRFWNCSDSVGFFFILYRIIRRYLKKKTLLF